MKIRPKAAAKGLLRLLPRNHWGDWLYHLAYFWVAHGRLPAYPHTLLFNDYIFYLKNSTQAYDPLRQFCADKSLVKLYVSAIVGPEFVPETIRTFTTSEELEGFIAPRYCVVKPTHLSGLVVFLEADNRIPDADQQRLALSLRRNLYHESREPAYKFVRPRIITEEAVGRGHEIWDYKVFCWKGEPRLIQVDVDRHSDHKRVIYDTNWRLLPVRYNYENCSEVPRPEALEVMLQCAAKLSAPFESIRVDFYLTEQRIYVGELTNFPEQGHGRFGSVEQEQLFSNLFFERLSA